MADLNIELNIIATDTRFLQRLALRNGAPINDAEDIVQNALLKAYVHLDTFRGGCKLRTWVGSILINEVKMHKRTTQYKRMMQSVNLELFIDFMRDKQPSPERITIARDYLSKVTGYIETLPLRRKQVFKRMLKTGEKDLKGAGIELKVHPSAIKAAYHNGRIQLKERMNYGNVL